MAKLFGDATSYWAIKTMPCLQVSDMSEECWVLYRGAELGTCCLQFPCRGRSHPFSIQGHPFSCPILNTLLWRLLN